MDRKLYPVVLIVVILLLAACNPNRLAEPTLADSTAADPGTPAPLQPSLAITEPVGPQAAIIEIVNLVVAQPLPESNWQPAAVAMPIYSGGEVWTKENATTRVQLDNALIRMAPNTILTFKSTGGQTVTLDLEQGQTWMNIEELEPGETLAVETPDAVAVVGGTRFSVRVSPNGGTVISTREGEVDVTAAGATVTVAAGMQTSVPSGGIPEEPVPLSIPEMGLWGMAADPHLSVAFPATRELLSRSGPGAIINAVWSPDNQLVYQTYDLSQPEQGSAWVILDPTTSKPVSHLLYGEVDGLSINPSGEIAYLSYRGGINRFCTRPNLTSPAETCFIPDVSGPGWPFWSPDGQWILFYAGSGSTMNLYRSRPDGSDLLQLTHWPMGAAHRQAWSPDSQQVAYVYSPQYGEDGQLWVINIDGTHNPDAALLENVFGDGRHVAWSPDGALLAVPVADAGIWLAQPGSQPPWQIPVTAVPGEYRSVEWSQTITGWPLMYRYRASDAAPWIRYALLSGHAQPYALGEVQWGPVWSLDGSQVALGNNIKTDPGTNQYEYQLTVLQVEPDFWPQP